MAFETFNPPLRRPQLRDFTQPVPCFDRWAVPDSWQTSNFPDEWEEDVIYRRPR